MGRATTFDHAHTPHRAISMSPHRSAAIRRVAQAQGVSSHVIIQRMISAGLTLFGEGDDNEEQA